MTDQTDDQSLQPSADDQKYQELQTLLSQPDEETPSATEKANVPNLYESPTFNSAKDDGTVDDLSWSSQINKKTDEIKAASTPQGGVLGSFGVTATPEEKEAVLSAREKRLSAEAGQAPSTLDKISSFGKLFLRDWWNEALGAPEPDIMAAAGNEATAQGESSLSNVARIQAEQDKTIAAEKERAGIAAARANPNAGVLKTIEGSGFLPGVAGNARGFADASARALADVPASVVESFGIGASIAGRAVGANEKIGDNTVQAVARYGRAWAEKLFPNDPAAQEDFVVKFGAGLGSTAGFWGVNSAALAMKVGSAESAALVATVGALSEAPQTYNDALKSRAEGRKVPDAALAMAFFGGLAIGSTEALPIAKNFPIHIQSNSKIKAVLLSIFREGGEEAAQEFGQAIGEDLLAKTLHDPSRRIGDDAAQNALIGFLSGGAVTGGRLAASPGARQQAYEEARAPRPQPPSMPPTLQGAGLSSPSGRSLTVDLGAGAGVDPAAQFGAQGELAGSARGGRNGAGPVEATQPTVPDINRDIYPIAPRDARGNIDATGLRDLIEATTGKRFWNQLSDQERVAVHQTLLVGQGIAPAPQAAAQPVPTPAAIQATTKQAPTGQQATQAPAQNAGNIQQAANVGNNQQSAAAAQSLPEAAAATAVTPQDIEQYSKSAGLKPQQAEQLLNGLQEYASQRGMTWSIQNGQLVIADRNGKSFAAPPTINADDVADMANKSGIWEPGEKLDMELADAGLDVRPDDVAAQDREGTAELFSPKENPALQAAQTLHDSGVPAQEWPTEAIIAGEQAGLVRTGHDGTPRLAPSTDATQALPDQVTDQVRRALKETAQQAAGPLVPSRFGQSLAHGDPIAIRALIDNLSNFSTQTLRAEFSHVARLAKTRNREQALARIARGLIARELRLQDENYRLSNEARDLIDQTVEDAAKNVPIAQTVANVQNEAAAAAVVDEIRRVAKHLDRDAIEILRDEGEASLREQLREAPAEDIQAIVDASGVSLGEISEVVVKQARERLAKDSAVHAPEMTIDEIVDESSAPKDRGADFLKDYSNTDINGDFVSETMGSVKKEFLAHTRNYLTKVSKLLSERGFGGYAVETKGKAKKSAKVKADKVVRVNEAGPAVSGEVMLNMIDENGNGVWVQIDQGSIARSGGLTVMARKATLQDRYGTKSQNQFLTSDMSVEAFADKLEEIARGKKAPPAPDTPKPDPFNPYAFSTQVVLAREGKQALRDRLNSLTIADLQSLANAQSLAIPTEVFEGESVDAFRDAVVAGAEQRLRNRAGAAGGEAIDSILPGNEMAQVEQTEPTPPNDDIKLARDPEAIVDALVQSYSNKVSNVARKYAVTLEKIGSDAGLFNDLINKIRSDKSVKKADLDALNWLYGGKAPAKSKALAIVALEDHFKSLSETEADAAVLAGEPAIITRDQEAHADDRRRAERSNRIRESERALSDGILSEGLRQDAEERGTAEASEGDGGGSGSVREQSDVADASADAEHAVRGESGRPEADTAGRRRDGDGRNNPGAASVREAVARANAERKARSLENYRITDADEIGAGGPKAKVRANIAAIRLVKELQETPDRVPTADEKKALVKYVGWGAFAQDVFAEHKPEWKAERQQLSDLLSAEEYAAARASTLNAHYTSKDVIDGMWQALDHLGFAGGRALEPSSGVGHFIGLTPNKVSTVTDWTAVELDKITGAITKYLYPGADVRVQGFETINFPDNFFDLAISNVPFGDYKLSDRKYPKLLIHDYFFAKSLDKVRPGGVVAFITSSGTMDKLNPTARRLIAGKADLVGAIRLPGGTKGAFAGNAGTEVTTDIIFLRKRTGADDALADAPKWMETVEVQTPEGPTKINEYFAERPEMMLGEMRLTGSMYRAQTPVLIGSNENLGTRIASAAKNLPANVILDRNAATEDVSATPELTETSVKEGAYFLKGGKLFQNVMGAAVAQKASGKVLKRIRGLMDMRDVVNDLLVGQRAGGKDEASAHLRAKLNKAYDAFVKEFGPIGKEVVSTQTRKIKGEERTTIMRRLPNMQGFDDDPDAGKLLSIENYDPETGKATKAAIFTSDIVAPYQRPVVSTPADAMAVSLNETGRIDMRSIAEMLSISEEEAADALGDRVYLDPNGEQHQLSEIYLSGDVVTKLEQASEAAKENPVYQRNVTALEAVQPTPLTSVDIRTSFGSPWIPAEDYNDFIAKVIGITGKVKYEPVSSQWVWIGRPWSPPSANSAYSSTDEVGRQRTTADELLIAAINSKGVKVFDKDSDGNNVLNRFATEQASIKIKAIADAFTGDPTLGVQGWVFEEPARAERLEALYNAKFNRLVRTQYDGSHLNFPGLATSISIGKGKTVEFSLRPHQKNVVWRAIASGNVLMDHSVGAGKTYAMIAAEMEQKRLGLIKRPMFVVPNHMLEQFSREFLQAYPNAKILVAQKKFMEAKNRKAFAARIAADNWDAVIITHSAFGRLPMSDEAYREYLDSQMAEIMEAWREAKSIAGEREDSKGSRDPSVKAIERKKKSIEAKLEKLMNKESKDDGVTFEELGVDHLTVDEAHLFKNLDYQSQHSNVKGIGVKGSQRAEDLFMKLRFLEQRRPGRTGIFATGTPLSRSMAEIYTMQRYLQLPLLKEYGVDRFDTWAATFGQIVTKTEQGINGKLKDVASFSKFINVPELQALYSRVADSVTANDLNLPRPTLRTGGPQIVLAEMSARELDETDGIIKQIEALKGPAVKGADNHLSLFTKMLQIATDMRLQDPAAELNPNGKIAKLVNKVAEIYKSGKAPALAQIIFLDMGVPGSKAKKKKGAADDIGFDDGSQIENIRKKLAGDDASEEAETEERDAEVDALLEGRFDLYGDIKKRLIDFGIPENEIATIYDAKNDAQKAQLFKDVREGKKRILIGSSAKMGVGTNVQTFLAAMHHVDAPWNPADVVQRDGRILRQGNENKEVDIYRYVTELSADAYRWQILARKADFEAQFRAGARGVREAEDIDSPLPEASTLRALATGDPRIMEHAELTKKVRELEAAKRGHERSTAMAKRNLADTQATVSEYESLIEKYRQDVPRVQDLKGEAFTVDLDTPRTTQTVVERKQAGEIVRDEILHQLKSHWGRDATTIDLGTISSFRMYSKGKRTEDGLAVLFGIEGAADYQSPGGWKRISPESDPVGIMRQFEHLVSQVQPSLAYVERALATKSADLDRLKKQAEDKPYPRALELAEAKVRVETLERDLKAADEKNATRKEPTVDDIGNVDELSALAKGGDGQGAIAAAGIDDGTPFVGDKEAQYQSDMRAFRLRQTLLRELNNAGQNGAPGSGIGADSEGGSASAGASGQEVADERSQGRDAIGGRLESDRAFRAQAIEAFLSPELRPEAIDARANAQGFTRFGFHGSAGAIQDIEAFRPTGGFGFHVALEPAGANARVGHPTAILDKVYQFLGAGRSVENSAVSPVRVRAEKLLRMPHLPTLGFGHWHQPMAWIAGMKHPDFDGPERLKRFVAAWAATNPAPVDRGGAVDHRFSLAISQELSRLGYDAVIYRDASQGIGKDSMFLWDASRVRSAYDFFHDDAAGAEGLTASDDYVTQDLETRLAALSNEEGLDDGQEAYGFNELPGIISSLKHERRLVDPNGLSRRMSKKQVLAELAWMRDRKNSGSNESWIDDGIRNLEDILPKFDQDLPRGRPFERSKEFEMGDFLIRVTSDDRHIWNSNYGGDRLFSIYPWQNEKSDTSAKALGIPLGRVGLRQHRDGRWEVTMVEVRPSQRGKGIAKALYAAVEKELGTEMRPSGILLPDGYAMWKKRNPELVRYHRYIADPHGNGGYWASPKYAFAARERYASLLAEARARGDNNEAARWEPYVESLQSAIDSMPDEGKTPEALNQMFALGERGNMRLTPEAQSKLPDIASEVEANLRKMLPSNVAIRVADRLFSRQGFEQRGRFRPDIRLVEVALARGADEAMIAAGHEVVHVLREAGAFTDAEWSSLVERADKVTAEDPEFTDDMLGRYREIYRAQAEKMGLPDSLAERFVARRVEEEKVARLAEAFFGEKKGRFGKTIDGLIQRMRDILDAIVRAFNGQGFTSPEAVFRRMENGVLKERVEPKPIEPSKSEAIAPDVHDARAIADMWSEVSAIGDDGKPKRPTLSIPGLKAPTIDRASTVENARRDIVLPDDFAHHFGLSSGTTLKIVYDHVVQMHGADDVPENLALDTPEKVRAHVQDIIDNWAYAYRYKDGKTMTIVRPMPNGMNRILALRDFVTPGHKSASAPTAYVDAKDSSVERLGKSLDSFGLDSGIVRTGLGAKKATLTILRKATATRHNPSLKKFMDILAKRQEDDGEMSALVPASRRTFDMPGYEARVETRQKADDLALRTRLYSIARDGKPVATMALSEREPDVWEAIGFRLDRASQGKGIGADLIDAIEQDIGAALSIDGIVPQGRYAAAQAIDRDRMRNHVPGGASLDNLVVPARSVEMMRDAASAAAEEGNDDAYREREAMKEIEASIPDGKYASDRIVEEMSALAARPAPQHLPKFGDRSKTDLDAPETGLSDLVRMVNDALGTQTRLGRLNPGLKAQMGALGAKLYGQFSRRSGLIRMAIPNDMVTLVHEGGHRLEIHPETAQGIESLKQAYAAELLPLASPGADQLSEGWAEWFSMWVVDPQSAAQHAPGVSREFPLLIERLSPEMLVALEAIQAGYSALVEASPGGVVRSRVRSTARPTSAIGARVEEVRQKGFVGAINDWMYQAVKGLVDDKHPLRVARDFLLREAARNLGASLGSDEQLFFKAVNDPYKIGRMMQHSRVHAASVLRNGVVQRGRTLPSGPSMRDVLAAAFGGTDKSSWNDEIAQTFGAYLVARRMNAEWDRFHTGQLDHAPDNLMTDRAWGDALTNYETAYPQFKQAARLLDQFLMNSLQWKRDNGFLSDEQYQDYVSREGYAPLNRVMDDTSPSASLSTTAGRTANKRKLIFRFQGSTRDFINPIESIVADVYSTQARVELNNLIGSLLKAAEAAGPIGGKIAERIPSHDIRGHSAGGDTLAERLRNESDTIVQQAVRAGAIAPLDAHALQNDLDALFDAVSAETLFRAVETNTRGERIAYLWRDGKRMPILLGADDLGGDIFNIMAGVGSQAASEPWLEAAVLFSQGFRAGVTKDPAYIAVNWFRDQLATWALSRDFKPFWTGLKGLGMVVKGSDASKRYEHFAGMMGGVDSHIIDSTKNADVLKLRESGFFATTGNNWFTAGFQKVLRATEITEAASRIGHMEAAYQRLLQDGFSEEQAAFEAAYNAHDVLDFSRRGSKMVLASRLVAFLNSQMQGLSAALRTATGERDTLVNVRDVISPYLKASEGIPLSAGEREALPTSFKMWMKLVSIGVVGLALAWVYRDDPEYEELTKSEMGSTHWFAKLGGVWLRMPKPFELAIFSNLFEAMFERIAKGDPLAAERFMRSVRTTVLLNPEIQTLSGMKTIINTVVSKPLDALTGQTQYGGHDDGLPQRLKGLPPEMQWDAYTSEFSKLLAAKLGMSPYKTDEMIRSLGATLGRDFLSASDWVLPRVNRAMGGALPGVSDRPRADKSFEDMPFISRITRRAARGAYSTWQFWQEMNNDSGRFAAAAEGYKRLMDEQKSPRDAQRMLMGLDDERRAYVLLQYYYKEKDKDMHPLNRAKQAISAYNAVRRQMSQDELYVERENKRGLKGLDATKISVAPSTQRIVNEILEDLSMREARNAQIALDKPGWEGRQEMPTDGLMNELRAAAPEVADELQYRLSHGRYKVYPFEGVKEVWPEVRRQLLTQQPGSPLVEQRVRAKFGKDAL